MTPCYISERFRDKELIIKRYINSPSLLLLLLYQDTQNPLDSTVLNAGSILGLAANMCSKPVVVKGLA